MKVPVPAAGSANVTEGEARPAGTAFLVVGAQRAIASRCPGASYVWETISALVNALLGEKVLSEGATPTTSRVTLVKWGDQAAQQDWFAIATTGFTGRLGGPMIDGNRQEMLLEFLHDILR